MGYFKLSDAMPLLQEILLAEKGLSPELPPYKPDKFYCEKCKRYHLIYSNVGNDHRDYRISPQVSEAQSKD